MIAGRILGIVFGVLGIAAIAVAFYEWNFVEDQAPLLTRLDAPSHPEFKFHSVEEWRSLALRRVIFWAAFGVSSVACGLGLLFSPSRSNLALFGAVSILALFATVLVLSPWLWTEFISFLAMSLPIYALRFSTRSRHD